MADMNAQTDLVLWQQLSEINSAFENLHDPYAILKILDDLRTSTRTLLNYRVRSRLRPLKILDLPNELLAHIFEYVKGETGIRELYFLDSLSRNTKDVKNLRLTCRRFYETSSHLLLPHIDVYITATSLSRSDEVSRHPYISKGVRAIRLSLSPLYDSLIAHDIRAFATYHASKMHRRVENWSEVVHWQMTEPLPVEVYQEAIEKAGILAESWDTLAAHGVDTDRADHLMLSRASEQYLQLYEDYKGLSSSLAQVVCSAMIRMPTMTWITIDDTNPFGLGVGLLSPQNIGQINSLWDSLISPIGLSDARGHELRSPPYHLIGELLLSIQRLGIPLKGFNIETPPPTALPSTSNTVTIHQPEVLRAMKQLKAFTFFPRQNIWSSHWTERAPEEWTYLTDFLLSILHTKSLQRIELNFYFMGTNDPPPLLSMAPLLLSYTWPNLQDLYFNGPFHFEELKAVVKPLGRNVRLQWCGYLMSSSWADVLDFLRQRNSWRQELGDVNGSIYGQECSRMDRTESNFIFRYDYANRLRSRATVYIQGSLRSNPVRDWEMGELDIPGPAEDNE
ncbi:hypothetical protein F4859DRAFT_486094 [Xylaria cf. heliscus]|nr:hypothetical protein F4859DRAFT_486094 [Xylaria cf. heliscus]